MLAAYLALWALKWQSPGFAIASTAVGLVGVLFKYTIFPVLGFGVGAALWLLWPDKKRRKRWLLVLLVQSLMIGGLAGLLLHTGVINSLLETEHMETTALLNSQDSLTRLLDLPRVWRFFTNFLTHYGIPAPLFAVLFIIGLPLYLWRARPWQRILTLLALVCVLAYPWFMIAYIQVPALIPRYNVTISGHATALLAGTAPHDRGLQRLPALHHLR